MQATVHVRANHQDLTETPEPAGTAVATLEPIIEGEVTAIIEPERKPTPKRRPYYLIPLCTLLACLIFVAVQNSLPLLTPTATIFILPKTATIHTTAPIQTAGRTLPALTLSQSQTVPATGHGHQQATRAKGYLTFYNGLFTSQTVAAGTIVTSTDGLQIITEDTATIPPANPPELGLVTIAAQAIMTGRRGNIAAYDIDTQCCLTAVKAMNTRAFTGGQDERDFPVVSKVDMDTSAKRLTTSLAKIEREALKAQLVAGEAYTPFCSGQKTTADHAPGDEATQLRVTVSLTCSAIAYSESSVRATVAQLLTSQAARKLGAGYTLLDVNVRVTHATATETQQPVVLTVSSTGLFVYALTSQVQQRMKTLVAGQSTMTALWRLQALPGIESASINADENTPLPKDPRTIHIVVIYTR